MLDAVCQAGPVDGAYFALHCAMASTGEEDPEGYILQEADRMLQHADAQ